MITLSVTWFVLCCLCGLVAIVIAATNEGLKSSTFWFHASFWIAALALLSSGVWVR